MASQRSVSPSLLMLDGETPGRVFELDRDVTIIGREPDCQITLASETVSRRHARVVRAGDGYQIEDLESRNGTQVNGRLIPKLNPAKLVDGARIQICRFTFVFDSQLVRLREEDEGSSTILGILDAARAAAQPAAANAEAKLRALLEVGRELSRSFQTHEILERALGSIFQVFPQADRGFALLREEDGGELVPQAVRYRKAPAGPLTASRTIAEMVMAEGKAILSSNVATDYRFQQVQSLAGASIRTMLCAPLLDRDRRPIGLLQIDTSDPGAPFNQGDLDLLVAVAGQVGVAVENVRLYRGLLQREKFEQGARDARQVLKALLPERRPEVAGYEFWDDYEPALYIGGDYFDYVPTAQGRWAVALGDVAGKGMPAALLMAKLSAEFRLFVAQDPDPTTVVARLNRQLADAHLPDRFVTFLLAVLDVQAHTLTIVNAGHWPPLIRRADGRLDAVGFAESGTPLAVERDYPYEATTVALGPGDVAILYTDGVTEAMDVDDRCLGMERLRAAALSAPPRAPAVGAAIVQAVHRHSAGRPPSDDVTLVCLGRTP
jgi:serine phosphatase RsbU (regulator of sigma subunit)